MFIKRRLARSHESIKESNKPEYRPKNNLTVKPWINKVTSIGKEKKNEPCTKPSWFERISNKVPFISKTNKPSTEYSNKNKNTSPQQQATSMRSWFSFSRQPEELKPDEESSRNNNKNKEVVLMKKMCGEFRDVMKVQNKEEREERQRELAKVRGARTFFKTIDTAGSNLKSNPRIRLRTDEDVLQSFNQGEQKSKSLNGDD